MRLLFVHQSADLYGSDRTLLTLAHGLQARQVECIVILPEDGPLKAELDAIGVETHVAPVVKLSRGSVKPSGWLPLLEQAIKSYADIDRIVDGRVIDVVHSNTIAVLGGALWARRRGRPHLWHVHEIITRPWIMSRVFPWLVGKFSDRIVCNSSLTRQWIVEVQPAAADKTVTVWNGIEEPGPAAASGREAMRQKMGAKPDSVVVTLAGRINHFKGQNLFLDAIESIDRTCSALTKLQFVMIGSPPSGQEVLREDLRKRIEASPLRDQIVLKDFVPDPATIWEATDIAVVPSTQPEPFGLVAIEAMCAEKPVIGAAHGGLLDIIVDGKTGYLVPPNDAHALAAKIVALASDAALRRSMGTAGRERQAALFTLEVHVEKMHAEYLALARRSVGSAA